MQRYVKHFIKPTFKLEGHPHLPSSREVLYYTLLQIFLRSNVKSRASSAPFLPTSNKKKIKKNFKIYVNT